jgi:hypothetical protein
MTDLIYGIRGALISIPLAFHLYLMPGPELNTAAMAGFFFLSGAFFMPRTLKYTLKALIIPMFAVSLVTNWLIPGIPESAMFFKYLRRAILICLLPVGNFMWFLWALVIFWGIATMFYGRSAWLLGLSVSAFLFLGGLPNPFNYLAVYGFPFMLGVISGPKFRLLIRGIEKSYQNPLPQGLSLWLVSLGRNSKWIYLTHLPYSNYVRILFTAGNYPLTALLFISWLVGSNAAVSYSKNVWRQFYD